MCVSKKNFEFEIEFTAPFFLPAVKFVSEVIGGDDVEQQDVFRLGVQPGEAKLHLGKHLPGRREEERRRTWRYLSRERRRGTNERTHTNQSLVRDQMCKSERCLDSGRFYLGPMIVELAEQTD